MYGWHGDSSRPPEAEGDAVSGPLGDPRGASPLVEGAEGSGEGWSGGGREFVPPPPAGGWVELRPDGNAPGQAPPSATAKTGTGRN